MEKSNDSAFLTPATTENPLIEQAKDQGKELVQHTQQTASDLLNQVQDQLKSRLTEEKHAASTSLGHVTQAVQQAAQNLREQEQEMLGKYADSAAGLVENFSNYLQKTDLEDMVGDIETVARKKPAVFVGSLFVLGLLAGRFLKSSGRSGIGTPANSDPYLPVPVSPTGGSHASLSAVRSNHDSFRDAAAI